MIESNSKPFVIDSEVLRAIDGEYLPQNDYLRDVALRMINKYVELYGKEWVLNHVKWVRNQLGVLKRAY